MKDWATHHDLIAPYTAILVTVMFLKTIGVW